jgi:hypothetical protein
VLAGPAFEGLAMAQLVFERWRHVYNHKRVRMRRWASPHRGSATVPARVNFRTLRHRWSTAPTIMSGRSRTGAAILSRSRTACAQSLQGETPRRAASHPRTTASMNSSIGISQPQPWASSQTKPILHLATLSPNTCPLCPRSIQTRGRVGVGRVAT